MKTFKVNRSLFSILVIAAIIFGSLSNWGSSRTLAQDSPAFIEEVRVMEAQDTGIQEPAGLTYSNRLNAFYVIDARQWRASPSAADFVQLTATEQNNGSARLAAAIQDPLNTAFDNRSNRMLVLQPRSGLLIQVPADASGSINRRSFQQLNVRRFGVKDPKGMTVDPATGELFILDASGPRILRILPAAGARLAEGALRVVDLKASGITDPRGIAFDPTTARLHVLVPGQMKLYELTRDGAVTAVRDLASFGLKETRGIVFAPSSDQTDDASIQSLYVADAGTAVLETGATASDTQSAGQIVEFTLAPQAALPPGTTLLPASLVQIIDTSIAAWSPSAPDPAGVDYWPLTGKLLITDSEVEEMPIYYLGKNVFQSSTAGVLGNTCDTTSFTGEPTGVAINPNNNHIFISDDAPSDKLFEISLGPDGVYCTGDDTVNTFLVNSLYGITDAEDVGYGNNKVFIGGGADAEVYVIPLGANGVMGGGDDGPVTHFDTKAVGFNDVEGITYNPANNTVFVVSPKPSDRYMGEFTQTGTLLRAYDLALMGSEGNIRSDVGIGPGSQNPTHQNIYIASRGVDNDNNRRENDGRVWEIHLGELGSPSATPPGPTATPTVTSTPGDPNSAMYVSFASGQSVGGVSSADEDILHFDGTNWSIFFDGSDVGLTTVDLTAFSLLDADSLLLAFDTAITVGGVSATPQDILRFDATSLGTITAGTFSMYFNGIDVGLDTSGEALDAATILPNGNVLISTTGSPTVAGLSGVVDEDVLAFTPTSLGDVTNGTWAMYFDGSDVGLADNSGEDVDALDVGPDGSLYLSTRNLFAVGALSGEAADVFICTPTSLGSTTACNYAAAPFFDASAWGLSANNVDGFELGSGGSGPTPTPTGPTPTPTNTFTPSPTFTPTVSPTPGGPDLIFADGFESGDFSAWTTNKPDAGDLSVSAAAAMQGGLGMQAVIDDTVTVFVTDDTPLSEPRYRARFYFDPNSITMAEGDAHFIFNAFQGDTTAVVRVEFQRAGGQYQLRVRILDDLGAWLNSGWIVISDAAHPVELDWRAASAPGANNGGVTLWIDGVQQADIANVDNDTTRVDRARLGAITAIDVGTLGTYYFDAFVCRSTYFGP